MTESGGGARDNEQYAVDNGGSTTGDTYSFGVAASTDRALGSLRSGTLVPIFGSCYTNNTGSTINSITIHYTGEQWRLGTAARTDQLNFEMSTNATSLTTGTWVAHSSLNFITPSTTGSTSGVMGARDGNAVGFRTALSYTITGLSIANGATFWIRWSDVDATGSDDGLAVDDFSLTPNSCPVSIAVTENFGNLPQNDGNICVGDQATLTATGAGTYAWSTSETTASIIVTPNTTTLYTVTITSGLCVSTDTLTIHVGAKPEVFNVTGGGSYCGVGSGVAIGVDGSEATATYFLYKGAAYVTQIPGTGSAFSFGLFTTAGTYSVVAAYNSTGCFIGMTGSAVINTGGVSFTAAPTNGACPESNPFVTLDVPAASGYKYDITIGASYTGSMTAGSGGTDINEDPVEVYTFPMPPSIAGTTYTVRVIDVATGCFSDQTFTLSAIPVPCDCEAPPFVNFTPLNSTSCDGATVTIGYTVENGPATINTTGFLGTFSETTLNDGTGTFTYTPAPAEVGFNLTIFASIADPDGNDPCEGDTASASIAVVALPTPSITISSEFSGLASNDGITCAGSNATLTTNGGGTYLWSTGATTSSIVVAPNITTTYTVTVTNGSGCSAEVSQIITVNPFTPTITVTENSGTTPNDGITCAGATVNASTSGGGTYLWMTGATTSAISLAPDITTYFVVTVTNNNGCSGVAIREVTVNPIVKPTFNAEGFGPYCADGKEYLLPASSTNGIAGTWSPSIISTTTPGTTTYIFTPAEGECADTASRKVIVTPIVEPVFSEIIDSYCQGETPETLPGESDNSIAGTWSPATVNTSTPGTTTYIFTPESGECADTASVKITVNSVIEPTFSILSNYCQGQTPASLPTTSNNGISGFWSPSSISTATPGTTTYLFFIDENEECADSASIKVVVSAAPDAPEVNNITVCEGGSTNISANSGPGAAVSNTFTWDFEAGITGAGISQSNTVATNGATQTAGAGLTGVAAQAAGSGCSAAITSTGYDITNASLADAVADNEYFEFCVGAAQLGYTYQGVNSIIWGNRISGTGPVNFAVVASNNLTTPLLTGMVTGTSCQMEGGAFTLNAATCYRIYYWGASNAGGTLRIDNMSITAQFAAPSGNYNFYDEDPALNANATPVATGTSYDPGTSVGTSDEVWVTCVAENGCESPATKVTVTVNAVPTLDIVQPESACLPTTIDATAVDLGESIAGGTTTYHATADDAENDASPIDPGTLTNLSSSRTIFVRYETTGGCFATGQIDVLVSERPVTPIINDLVACIGETTTITPSVDSTVVVSWNFNASNTAGGSTDINLATAGNASRGAGVGDAGFVSGCNGTSTAYSGNNWSAATEADAISGNDYFEFPINILGPVRLTKFSFFERASGTGPISWALYVNGTKYKSGDTSDPCMQESRDLDIAICGTSALIRIYAWRETTGGSTSGTWRVDEVEATLEPAVLYNFYSDNTLTNKLAGPVASYTPELVDGEPLKLFVTAVSACASCESLADSLTITAGECTVSISDPCVCQDNAPVIANGTYSNEGSFKDIVRVEGPSGMIWTVKTVSGLYNDAEGTDVVEVGDVLVETSPGVFELPGYHIDSVGYTITVSNGRGTELSSGNTCYYPDPSFAGLPLLIAPTAAPFNVTGTVANGAAGVGTFSLNGVPQAGASAAPTVLTINPATLPVGDNTLTYSFDAGTASSKNLSDPGCVKTVRQTFRVAQCGCQDLTVSLDANCQFALTANVISDGNCNGATVRVMDNDPSNGDTIDCAGVWTYGMFDAFGNIICWGKVTAEDKTAPILVCTDWYQGTLDCYDVDFVLNNRQTIGNVNATSSPRPAPTSTQTINNAKGIAGTGACNLVPPNLVADNINNLGYTYFKDNCDSCGCLTTVKWSDRVVFYNCDQMKANGGIYARIYRTWVATDCRGMSRDTVQEIPFARPAIDDFVFNGDGDGGKYDRVVEYSSCVPDKELIQKSDVMPFVCSYFNRTAAPRFSRCLFLDEVECNYSVSIKDTEFPICGGKGLKIDRELYVFDWCAGGVVDTFHILIKIGDFEAPYLEYAHHAPFDISTGPMDCTAAFPITAAGIKSQFGVEIKDNCALGNISVKLKTKDRYVKGILVAEDTWDQVGYTIMNGMMVGVPVGRHRLIIDAFDGCYNAKQDSFEFEIKDKIAPVMKCDDDLHVSLSNANGYTSGYAQVSAEDIDEGSWDNCKLAWIAVRRNVPDGCAASFIQKGYDTNGNGKLDALPADNDYSKADGFDLNGDGDIEDFGETFILKGGKLMTPLLDYVEFFCCDLTERVTVELWGGDIYGNTNYCWMDLLIEDKVAPTCIAPWAITVDCDDKGLAQIDDKVASAKIFGDVTITTGSDCAALDTVYSTVKKLKCGYGYIDRIWTLTKQTVKGPITITCTQRIWVNPVHEYNICFPKDVSTDCKTPIIDTVITDELGCDILAVNVHDKRYDASDDECYKIFRTYSVINWCTYDDRCGDPLLQTNISIIDRAVFGNYGKAPIYVLVRDREDGVRDGVEEFYISKDLIHNNADDIRFKPGYCEVAGEFYHSFIYTQIIKVYDDTRPVVTGTRDTFCTSPTACTANITKVVTLKDNCTDKVELETQFLMIAPFQTLEAGQMILYSTPRWSTKDLGNGQFEIKVANLPEGTHDLIVVGRDECGNLSLPTRIPFVVKDCKAPAPICINGLSVDLMPDGNNGGMMTVWASDFVASKIYDCNGQGPETKDGLKLITKYSVNRVQQPVDQNQTSISVNCADLELGFILVELHAWDAVGNHDFCVTFIEVQDNNKVCPTPADKVKIAGTIATEGVGNLQGVSVTLSGSGTQSDMTGTDGNYEFVNITKGGDFTVTPQLDKNHLNGVSTFDLVLIQKHILGVQALNSPYKMIAADANNSKSISTLDMIQIRKLILNIDTHFANNTSWRFVDATYRFPNQTNPWSTSFPEVVSVNDLVTNVRANFVAIKVGDVNASASVNNAASAEVRTNGQFKLKTQEQNLKSGNEYRVAFTAEDLQNIQGYQFALNLDQSKVELVDIEYGVAKAENFGIFKNEGLITTSWNSKYEPGALFTLVLRAKANAKLSSTLSLNRVVSPEAYDQHNENLGIALNFEGIQVSEAYELRQNTPNPFSDETVIGFSLPKATKGTLTVRDVKGALIYKVEGNYTKGSNQVTLKKEQLGASGVLYYTLETTEFTATKKMVILE